MAEKNDPQVAWGKEADAQFLSKSLKLFLLEIFWFSLHITSPAKRLLSTPHTTAIVNLE